MSIRKGAAYELADTDHRRHHRQSGNPVDRPAGGS
jgi:hypothetical protein